MTKQIKTEARKAVTDITINRGLFSDIYDECCENEVERKILDIIIFDFFSREVFNGKSATERAVAKLTGLSKSGVRVVQDRAMKKVKKYINKIGVNSVNDVVSENCSVNEKEQVNEAKKGIKYAVYDVSSFKKNLYQNLDYSTDTPKTKPIKTFASIQSAMEYIDDNNGGLALINCFGMMDDERDEVEIYMLGDEKEFTAAGKALDEYNASL